MSDQPADALPQPVTITLQSGTKFTLHPLGIAGFARAEAGVRGGRLKEYFDGTKGVNLSSEVQSGAIAKIMTTPIDFVHLISTFEGMQHLVWQSLKGTHRQGFAHFFENVSEDDVKRLAEIAAIVSGLTKPEPEEDEGADPLDQRALTSTPEVMTFRGGKGSSATSATGTD